MAYGSELIAACDRPTRINRFYFFGKFATHCSIPLNSKLIRILATAAWMCHVLDALAFTSKNRENMWINAPTQAMTSECYILKKWKNDANVRMRSDGRRKKIQSEKCHIYYSNLIVSKNVFHVQPFDKDKIHSTTILPEDIHTSSVRTTQMRAAYCVRINCSPFFSFMHCIALLFRQFLNDRTLCANVEAASHIKRTTNVLRSTIQYKIENCVCADDISPRLDMLLASNAHLIFI